MWFRCSTVAILLFCSACKPATSEGTPYASNMTGFDSSFSPDNGAHDNGAANSGAADKMAPEEIVVTTPADEPEAVAPVVDAKSPEAGEVVSPETDDVIAPNASETSVPKTEEAMPAIPAIESKTPSATDATANAAQRPPKKALAPDKTLPRKPGVQDLTFDDIAFEMEKGAPFTRSLLPPKIEELSNQKVRIRGYILPSFESRGIKQFVLVRDNMECCFGPGAALYDCILVEMKGPGVDFTVRPVTVEGIFEVKEYLGGDGKHLAIYRMDGESAR